MGMALDISSELLDHIRAHAAATPAIEVCGLLLGRGEGIMYAERCANVARDPACRFEIDPAALIAAHRRARAGGFSVIGHYHSHPGGEPVPSPRDAEAAAADDSIWLIVGGGVVRAWRAVAAGAVCARFDPVDFR